MAASDWFRQETLDDSLQPTIDMLLNVAVFIWFGAVCPWNSFAHNNVIPLWRLVLLGITVLLFRRIPIVMAMHKQIHQIEEFKQAWFVGFFGPIGVSAIFYLYVSLEYLRDSVTDHGHEREDAVKLGEIMNVVIWFLVVCSIVSSLHDLLDYLYSITPGRARSFDPAWNTRFPNPSHFITSPLYRKQLKFDLSRPESYTHFCKPPSLSPLEQGGREWNTRPKWRLQDWSQSGTQK